MSEIRIFALTPLVFVLLIPASLHAQNDSARVRTMLGCYRLQIDTASNGFPSTTTFRLDATRPVDWLNPWFRPLDTLLVTPTQWRIASADSLELRWSNGYSSVDLLLHLAPDTLRGRSFYGSDEVSADRTFTASAWPAPCPASMADAMGHR
jgi:hypothetical protein